MTTELVPASEVQIVNSPEVEATEALQLIRTGLGSLWEGLARMVACEGWRTLGYTSFRRWASDELHLSLQSADLYLKKTRRLMSLSDVMKKTVGELEQSVALRNVRARRPTSPAYTSMRTSVNRLRTIPALTDPKERRAATELREHLNRLLEEQ